MNDIEQLRTDVRSQIPRVHTTLSRPKYPEGHWWLDLELEEHRVVVEWRQSQGFGVTASTDNGYGEGPDEVYTSREEAVTRAVGLLVEKGWTRGAQQVTP